MEELAHQLSEIVEPQDRSSLWRTKLESVREGACVDLSQCGASFAKSELHGRDDDEVQIDLTATEWKRRAAEDFVGPIAHTNRAWRGVDGGANRIDPRQLTDCDCFPNRELRRGRELAQSNICLAIRGGMGR